MFTLGKGMELEPADAFSSTYACIGIRGSGKSYGMLVFAEQALKHGFLNLFLDPQGICHGLRSRPDGKPGFPVLLMGGPHNPDIEIKPDQGARVAELFVQSKVSTILDLSEFRKNETRTFLTAFLTELFRLKNRDRTPTMVYLDEAHLWAPQQVDKSETNVVGALEDITGRGRQRGLFMFLTTQRAAKINKNVLSQVETLFVMRQIAPQDRNAVADWLRDTVDPAQAREALESIASLQTGEAWAFSPAFLGVFERFKFAARTTADTSSTPRAGTELKVGAKIATISPEIVSGIAQALNPPPKPKPEPKKAEPPAARVERVEVLVSPLADDERKRLEDLSAQLSGAVNHLAHIIAEMVPLLNKIGAELGKALAKDAQRIKADMTRAASVKPKATTERPVREIVQSNGDLSGPQQKLLNVLAEAQTALGLEGLDKSKLAAWADVAPKSSGLRANLSTLKQKGYIEYGKGGLITATDEGLGQARPVETPMTLASYRAAWAKRLSGPQRAMIDTLLAAGQGVPLSKEYLAEQTGQSITSSGFRANLSTLRSHGLTDYQDGDVVLTDMLFPEGVE